MVGVQSVAFFEITYLDVHGDEIVFRPAVQRNMGLPQQPDAGVAAVELVKRLLHDVHARLPDQRGYFRPRLPVREKQLGFAAAFFDTVVDPD